MLGHPILLIHIKHISRLYPNDTLIYRMIYDESPMQAILFQFQTDMPLYERPTQRARFMGFLSAPDGPDVGPRNLAIRVDTRDAINLMENRVNTTHWS